MQRILIVEDDVLTNESVCEYLQDMGHIVFSAYDGEQALELFNSKEIDLVVLDIMLPQINGLNVLKKIRQASSIPILMLTAMDDMDTQIMSFDNLADDYVTKPFNMEELLARAASQIRRNTVLKNGILPQEEICFDKITIVPQIKGILKENKEVLLTGKEFDLLYFLASSPMRAYTKKQIYKAVWKDDYVYDDNNIMALVSKIRKKIEDDPEKPRIIQTVRGVGYRFGGGQ